MGVHDPLGCGQFLSFSHYKSTGVHDPLGCGQFLSFSHYMSMGAVYGHGGHLDLRTTTICIYFQSPFNTRLRIKLEEIWPRGFRAEVFKGVNGQTDNGRWAVITIAHPEPLAQVC